MRKFGLALALLIAILTLLLAFFVLGSEDALVTHPKGLIAQKQLDLIIVNLWLMGAILVPTLIVLLTVVWKYRSQKKRERRHEPENAHPLSQWILWVIPSIVVVVMALITWKATHELDPYRPIESEVKPLNIQVVALDWKWLFIYPEQEIATVNFVQFPVDTPIHFDLAADGSPMNSFWVPSLSGQIYAMTGMVTQLHLMAHEVGEYRGRAAEINGAGYAGMTFVAKSSTAAEFEEWVESVKKSSEQLDDKSYAELFIASENHPVAYYSHVKKDLFNEIVMKYMTPSL